MLCSLCSAPAPNCMLPPNFLEPLLATTLTHCSCGCPCLVPETFLTIDPLGNVCFSPGTCFAHKRCFTPVCEHWRFFTSRISAPPAARIALGCLLPFLLRCVGCPRGAVFTQGCYIASSLLGVKFGFSVHMADKLQQKDENLPGRPVGLRRAGRLMLGARSEGQAKVLRQAQGWVRRWSGEPTGKASGQMQPAKGNA